MSVAQSTRKHDGGKIPGPYSIANLVEIRIYWATDNGKTVSGTLNGKHGGTFTVDSTLANTLLSGLGSSWVTRVGSYVSPGTSMNQVSVRDMSAIDNPQIFSNGTGHPGTGLGQVLPGESQIVLTENISGRGRGAKGRLYLPGWTAAADAGGGVIAGGVVTALGDMGTDWIGVITAAGLTPVVPKPARQAYIGLTGANHPARPAGSVDVVQYVCRDNHWDTQRRRGLS